VYIQPRAVAQVVRKGFRIVPCIHPLSLLSPGSILTLRFAFPRRFVDDIDGTVVGEKHCFELKSQTKSFIVACPGVSEKLTWMDALESAIKSNALDKGGVPETPQSPGYVSLPYTRCVGLIATSIT
jgi:hypothetical protein